MGLTQEEINESVREAHIL
jgi:NIMA (never in mitosis gene a)-related kinase 1/4/5